MCDECCCLSSLTINNKKTKCPLNELEPAPVCSMSFSFLLVAVGCATQSFADTNNYYHYCYYIHTSLLFTVIIRRRQKGEGEVWLCRYDVSRWLLPFVFFNSIISLRRPTTTRKITIVLFHATVNAHRRNATHKHLIEPSSSYQQKQNWAEIFERKRENPLETNWLHRAITM